MTKRELNTKLIARLDKELDKELINELVKELNALDNKNAKAKEKRLAKSVENEPIEKAICDYLNGHKIALASELAEVAKVSTSKVVAVAKKMTDNGTLTCKRVKIAKVGERNGYSLVQ